jgi:hypothetical protein
MAFQYDFPLTRGLQIGFPVLTVTETPEGIRVRQDRFLDTGKGEGMDNETLWLDLSLHEFLGVNQIDIGIYPCAFSHLMLLGIQSQIMKLCL